MQLDGPALTPQEVAELLTVTPDTINRWADEGRLLGFKLPSGRWRFHRAAIEALVAGAGAAPQPESAP